MKMFSMLLLAALAFLLFKNGDETNRPAPEFPLVDAEKWLNSSPLKMADLRGKVVMLDVWTFMCWNCTNSIPWVREMQKRFEKKDFLIVGIHTPEFDHEKDLSAVKTAVAKHKLLNPQLIDNDYKYWRALNNRYWPAFYIIDKKGNIRHVAVGEVHIDDHRDREIQQLVETLLVEK